MKIGVGVPTYDQYADPHLVVETAKRAEALGFDAIWCIDHVVIPGYDTKRIGSRHFELLTTLPTSAPTSIGSRSAQMCS